MQHMASAPSALAGEVVAGGPAPAQPPRDFGAASTSAARGTAEPTALGNACGDRAAPELRGRGHGDPAVSGRGSLSPNFARGDGLQLLGFFAQLDSLPLAAPGGGA